MSGTCARQIGTRLGCCSHCCKRVPDMAGASWHVCTAIGEQTYALMCRRQPGERWQQDKALPYAKALCIIEQL